MLRSPGAQPLNSTIVRSYKQPVRERAALASLRIVSRMAPGVAARLAVRLFLTPPRYATPDREQELARQAGRTTVRVEGRGVRSWTIGTGPRVLLVHGWGGRGAQLGAFVEPLVTQGLSVAWFDGPGHGASDGRRVTIPEMATALRAVAETVGPVRGIIAHSGGGVVSAWAVRRWFLDGFVDLPGAIALVAPPADFTSYYERFARLSGLTPAARAQFRRELELTVGVRLEAFDLPRFAAELPMAALVVHDREDGEVPWAEGAAVAAAWPDADLVTTHGLGHRRILRDPSVVGRVTDFLAGRLSERPGVTRDLASVSTL